MAELFSSCSQCGAPAETADDGRSLTCRYCGSHTRVAVDPAKIAAAIHADLHAVGGFLEHLATVLEAGFGETTVVQRSGGLFRPKQVESVEVMFEDAVFRLHRSRGNVRAEHGTSVRGIVLNTDVVALEDWIERLCLSLASLSDSSAAARSAIGRIAGGPAGH
jgi:hypothetical protein